MPLVNLNTLTVTGTYVDLDGQPVAGTVTFMPSAVLQDPAANQIILPKLITVTLDVNGSFTVQLPATDDPDITPSFTYTVTEQVPGGRTYTFALPINTPGGVLDLADISAEAPPPDAAEMYALITTMNDLENRVFTAEPVSDITPTAGAATVIEPFVSSITRITLTEPTTLTFPALVAGKAFSVALVQDATGGRTVTWPASVRWDGTYAPILSTTPLATDLFSFLSVDGLTWIGVISAQGV